MRPFAGISVPVLSAEDLTVFKIIFNRPRDWLDIGRMLQVRGEGFDSEHARAWRRVSWAKLTPGSRGSRRWPGKRPDVREREPGELAR